MRLYATQALLPNSPEIQGSIPLLFRDTVL